MKNFFKWKSVVVVLALAACGDGRSSGPGIFTQKSSQPTPDFLLGYYEDNTTLGSDVSVRLKMEAHQLTFAVRCASNGGFLYVQESRKILSDVNGVITMEASIDSSTRSGNFSCGMRTSSQIKYRLNALNLIVTTNGLSALDLQKLSDLEK